MGKWLSLAGLFFTSTLMAAPIYTVPAPDAEQLAEAAAPVHGPVPVGLLALLQIDSRRDGVWTEQGSQRLWQADIHGDGARFLSLKFDLAVLPPGAAVWIRGSGGGVQGPYTQEHVRDGHLRTALVHGDTASIELRVPAGQPARLRLAAVNYGLREPFATISYKSGDCNIDVACPTGDAHPEQIRSAVLLVYPVGQNAFVACSGLLVNNTRNDLTPYLLTADHCGLGPGNAGELEVYWRYQRETCEQPGSHGHDNPDPSFSQVGAEWLADDSESDFTLLVLGSRANPFVPPANFEPFWSGWNVTSSAPQSGVSVHHPNGQEKTIAVYDSPARAERVDVDGTEVETWRVIWSQGTTEQGSSGSGLWNQDGQVVGVLSGGAASCSNQREPDFYGRLNVAWENRSACDRQLRFWLDPDGNGDTSFGGADRDSAMAQPQVPACGGPDPTPTPTASPTASPDPTPTPTPTPAPSSGGGGSGSMGLLVLLFGLLRRSLRGC